jgi:hypothetical protein
MGSADTTTTSLTGTPAVLAMSATTGSISDCGRFSGPGDTDAPPAPGDGRSPAGADDDEDRGEHRKTSEHGRAIVPDGSAPDGEKQRQAVGVEEGCAFQGSAHRAVDRLAVDRLGVGKRGLAELALEHLGQPPVLADDL